MAYRVKITAPAEADAYAAFEQILELTPQGAQKWLSGLIDAIFSLEEMPTRCQIIPEAEEIGQPIRQLLYGKRSGTYRILFDMQENSEEGLRVRVLRIWHGARDRIKAEDLTDAGPGENGER